MIGYSLCWDAYKSSVCSGFSSFQQNGEFVDMTLAADGHFVKVHQALIAMVSPYLKELIMSAPCQHPVIFLNNVSYKTLSSLLEYIYMGEVVVPSDTLSQFIQTAKSLHIKGLEDLNNMTVADRSNKLEDNSLYHVSGTKRIRLPGESENDPILLPAAARKIHVKPIKPSPSASFARQENASEGLTQSTQDCMPMMDLSVDYSSDDGFSQNDHEVENKTKKTSNSQESVNANLQYSVSIRGSLQVILNRYIYNLTSTPGARLKRWRCVEYRSNKCMAFLVTKGNVVVNRANLHNHSFHDKKILQKIEKKAIFSAIDDVREYQLKENERSAKEFDEEKSQSAPEYKLDVSEADKKGDNLKSMWNILTNKRDS